MSKENRMCTSFSERNHHSPMRKELTFFGTISLDDVDDDKTIQTNRSACNSPKFLRTQSSSGLFATPKKSRSVTRFLGNLINSSTQNVSDAYVSSGSIRDKINNCSSLNNLSRLMSLSTRNQTNTINQCESFTLHNKNNDGIDEHSKFRHLHGNDKRQRDSKTVNTIKLLELCANNQRSSNRIARLRLLQSRRRSVSCDSWDIDKQQKR